MRGFLVHTQNNQSSSDSVSFLCSLEPLSHIEAETQMMIEVPWRGLRGSADMPWMGLRSVLEVPQKFLQGASAVVP